MKRGTTISLITSAHDLRWDHPTPRFLDGALLGNGGLGAVVTTRPDAIVLHLGHNDVWDRRIDESHREHIRTFREVLSRVEAIDPDVSRIEDDPWFDEYRAQMISPYAAPYPRPLGCGSLVLGLDRRHTQMLGHDLEIATGVCRVRLQHDGANLTVELFVDQDLDDVHVRCIDSDGHDCAAPFTRARLLPDPDGPAPEVTSDGESATTFILPRPGEVPLRPSIKERPMGVRGIAFTENLPLLSDQTSGGGQIAVDVVTTNSLTTGERPDWYGNSAGVSFLERRLLPDGPFHAVLRLRYSYEDTAVTPAASASKERWIEASDRSAENWCQYWQCSTIELSDKYLERAWYRTTYFTHCVLRPGRSAPGLWGNWIYRNIGSAWHGDYHMNYNAQQLYWGVLSSNRVEQHLPYVSLVEHIAPVARAWAHDYYEMRGAAYPHSAYNTPMTVNPYPNPVWAWEVSESPWTVQSLWWHFKFTRDRDFLRDRAFPLLREVVLFLVDYLSRPEVRWDDGLTHIYPTVPPELYGLAPGLRRNFDCLIDIALIRFVFQAYAESCKVLGQEDAEGPLVDRLQELLDSLPKYPTAETSEGPVFVSVPGESPNTVYNVPIPGMTIFPGEDHSWESRTETLETARRSVRRQLLEGGNELVFANLQATRLGILDLDRFSRQLQYCELKNGTYTDMVLQVHGRYNDATPFEFMADKGIWTENFAITAVINELLLQSYSGTVRLFPNIDGLESARFNNLRATGAFLISASMDKGVVSDVEIRSEMGEDLRIVLPWPNGALLRRDDGTEKLDGGIVTIATTLDETFQLEPR